jgi:hypothetical protein
MDKKNKILTCIFHKAILKGILRGCTTVTGWQARWLASENIQHQFPKLQTR